MDHTMVVCMRLVRQQLLDSRMKEPKDVVSWMGAIQAQDYNMAKWAIGIRAPGCTDKTVEEAFNRGEILRTHVLRPTWHFVVPEDIRWMLELTAPRIRTLMRARDRELEISDELCVKSNRLIRSALEGGKHLTRSEFSEIFKKGGIPTNTDRLSHLMVRAELDGVVCSGAKQGKQHTYALLEERVPVISPVSKEKALAKLARIYFTSHGPATLSDFSWWSGLPVSEARYALEMIKPEVVCETVDMQSYWIAGTYSGLPAVREPLLLLPAFDEYIISYRERKMVIISDHYGKAISSNGIFRPVILKDGRVIGIWKKTPAKNKTVIPAFFEQPDLLTEDAINKAVAAFNLFITK